ncbi:MAG: S8 family serine peptidase [Cytophagales bacterium]|nr:S8 family serine peptidase [Cytophagales bacterium]
MKKILFVLVFGISLLTHAQEEPPKSWFTLDSESDQTQGVSADKVHEMMTSKKSRTVIVAVIDTGVDIEHEDLLGKIWLNEDEIPENGIDDDKNGYIDDVNGWNFIGNKNGENVVYDTYELTREYIRLKPIYDGLDVVSKNNKDDFEYWTQVKNEFTTASSEVAEGYDFYYNLRGNVIRFNSLLLAYLDTEALTLEDVKAIESSDKTIQKAKESMTFVLSKLSKDGMEEIVVQLNKGVDYFEDQALYKYNPAYNSREIVGDDWSDPYEIGYGNNNVEGPDASHGTHVSGVIAALRDNELGIRGIAKDVMIMPIRAVPQGDERDKDVANAIRYAVDNGAHIINMSFGKPFVYRKNLVDEAIRYAIKNNVLMIHAAGNSSKNLDESNNFPTPMLTKSERATNWLEAGASSWGDDENFVASFSNYGKSSVDIFAPGVKVYSAIPDSEYKSMSGTSMAAPATAGVAAVVMSYFPDLTAEEVRSILKQSVRKFGSLKVNKPGTDEMVKFSDLSITGGLVNAVEAVKLARQLSKEFQAKR